MRIMSPLRRLAALFLFFSLAFGAGVDRASAEPEKGWRIYLAARRAAGAETTRLRDYSFRMTPRLERSGNRAEFESVVEVVLPNLIRQQISAPFGVSVIVFDGASGRQIRGGRTKELPAAGVARIRADLARALVLLGTPPPKRSVRFKRRERVEGRQAEVIEINDVGGTLLRLFVDAETGDLVKQTYVGDVPGGGMARVEESFSDFVAAGGLRWHKTRRVTRNGKEALRSTRRGFKVNAGLTREDILR